MPMVGGAPLPPAAPSVAMMLARFALILGNTFARHLAILLISVSARHGLRSFAPMSIVTSWTCPRWLARNFAACLSCEPAGYVQMPPLIMVAVVSPGQPSLTSFSVGLPECSAVKSWFG